MNIKLVVGSEKLDYNVEEELFFDIDHISRTLQTHTGQLAWWASLLAIKEKEYSDKKVNLDGREGEISIFLRTDEDTAKRYNKKVTEGVINAELSSNEELMIQRKDLNETKLQIGYLKAMVKGMSDRSPLLATAGSIRRSELEAGMRSVIKKTTKKHT